MIQLLFLGIALLFTCGLITLIVFLCALQIIMGQYRSGQIRIAELNKANDQICSELSAATECRDALYEEIDLLRTRIAQLEADREVKP